MFVFISLPLSHVRRKPLSALFISSLCRHRFHLNDCLKRMLCKVIFALFRCFAFDSLPWNTRFEHFACERACQREKRQRSTVKPRCERKKNTNKKWKRGARERSWKKKQTSSSGNCAELMIQSWPIYTRLRKWKWKKKKNIENREVCLVFSVVTSIWSARQLGKLSNAQTRRWLESVSHSNGVVLWSSNGGVKRV